MPKAALAKRKVGARRVFYGPSPQFRSYVFDNCKQCGKKYKARVQSGEIRSSFCSIKCAGVWKRSERVNCQTCNKKATTAHGKYCSVKCWDIARAKRKKEALQKRELKKVRNCRACGNSFLSFHNQRYCSEKCGEPFVDRCRIIKTCRRCGKEYHPKTTDQIYCSVLCFHPPRPARICANCNGQIASRKGFLYCSNKCFHKHRMKIAKEKFPKCESCGNLLERRQKRFCNYTCMAISKKKYATDEDRKRAQSIRNKKHAEKYHDPKYRLGKILRQVELLKSRFGNRTDLGKYDIMINQYLKDFTDRKNHIALNAQISILESLVKLTDVELKSGGHNVSL